MMHQGLSRLEYEEMNSKFESGTSSAEENTSISSSNEKKKTCADCGTSKTPLWRGGPAGPKSLCNACGIKSRKRRQATVFNLGTQEKKQRSRHKIIKKVNNNIKSQNNNNNNENWFGALLNGRSLDIRGEDLMKRKVWRMLGEEEQAAMLLMSLSCGSVYG